MTTEQSLPLPLPLVPADCDLRDFAYMELDVRTLRDSRFAAQVSADAFRAGVLLWCAAWHQLPASSLPDDDIDLANLAGYGRFVKEWRKVRAEALMGYVKCSDGRLYHEVVAAKANSAWTAKLHHHYDRARDRLRKVNKARAAEKLAPIQELTFERWDELRIARAVPMEKADASAGIPSSDPPPSGGIPPKPPPEEDGIPPENALRGNGEGEGYIEEETTPAVAGGGVSPSAAARPLALVGLPKPQPPPIPDCPHQAVLDLWREVLPHLPQHEPEQWRGTRADHLRARWREVAAAKRWPDAEAGLVYLRRLFGFVGQSPFLNGKVTPRDPGRKPFFVTLAWLVKPENWAKTVEGEYHPEAEATA